jgi:hypothetical protein
MDKFFAPRSEITILLDAFVRGQGELPVTQGHIYSLPRAWHHGLGKALVKQQAYNSWTSPIHLYRTPHQGILRLDPLSNLCSRTIITISYKHISMDCTVYVFF